MSSGFVSEVELAEARRRRQQQWELVRQPDQPEEAPEETFDPRPLYQRLEEQKNKKDAEFEEAHKLKNMIRGLDDDEVGFLELVEQSKASVARQISLEEQREMKEFRERVSTVQDSVERERLQQISSVRQPINKKSSTSNTRSMLQGVIVKKRKVSETDSDKNDQPPAKNGNVLPNGDTNNHRNGHSAKEVQANPVSIVNNSKEIANIPVMSGRQCIAILPGIGPYKDSSDSECSDDSDDVN
ncbi:PSME3-interacting protein isoform X2 [Arctopsyche grandis]|uniref:PSME3-interacting protein isoform X2 n=1 Tax=Arctopsyche grandis TaxID=121162 RepID=UPI00406D6DB9